MRERAEALLYAIGNIDDRFITEVAESNAKKNRYTHRWMKWGLVACFALILAISVPTLLNSGNRSNISGDIQPMIYVNGEVYGISAEEPYDSYQSEFVYIGEITSAVDSDEYPDEEMQSNDMEIIGASVYQYGDDMVVYIDGQYWIYEASQGQ